MENFRIRFITTVVVIVCIACFGEVMYAQDTINERLEYKMTYMGLAGAESVFILKKIKHDQVSDTLCFIANVKTRGVSDAIFRIRNHYESFIDIRNGLPCLFKKQIDQPNIQQELQIIYDHNNLTATSSFGTSWSIPPLCYNLFSMVNQLRNCDKNPGDTLQYNVDIESQIWSLKGIVSDLENKKTRIGLYPVYEIDFNFYPIGSITPRSWKTDLLFNRIGKEGGRLLIWLSADHDQIPLKLRFGDGFASVEMNLIDRSTFAE